MQEYSKKSRLEDAVAKGCKEWTVAGMAVSDDFLRNRKARA